ncbi:unnamed protein product, partial [Effrenium voratum]
GFAKDVCGVVCKTIAAINDAPTEQHLWASLCPTAGDARDVWKPPVTLVLGIAAVLPQRAVEGLVELVPDLRALWEDAALRLTQRSLSLPVGALDGCRSSVVAVWPQHVAGGAGVMQDPHVLHFLGGASIVMMDVATLKCSGRWANASRTLGGPKALHMRSCLRSIAATHFAALAGPCPEMLVGAQQIVGSSSDLPPAWQRLALKPPAATRGTALGAFGAWWPALRQLWAEAGAILACGSSPGAEGCCWAVVGRLADELRPWEEATLRMFRQCLVGSDSPTLLSATLLLGWLAMEKVLYCDDWEDAATGEIQCSCGAPLPADGKPSEVMNGRLIPAAPRAARALLQLLAEVVVAGEASNVQKLFTSTMANEDWQVLYSCALQMGPPTRRHLLVDRGLHLPPVARQRVARSSAAQPLDELLEPPNSDPSARQHRASTLTVCMLPWQTYLCPSLEPCSSPSD